jgi:membrane dipeptidase
MKKNLILWALLFLGGQGCGDIQPDYMAIHQNALVVDLHSDTPMKMRRGFDFAARDTTGHMDLPRLKEGGIDLQVLACFVSTDMPADECRPRVDEMIDSITAQVDRNQDKIEICRTAADAERIVSHGKIAAFIGIENGVAINNDLENLKHFFDRGVRYLTLTHTASNDWCISSADTNPAFNGLTEFGRQVVRKMNELGIIVDLSHAHPLAVEEALRVSTDPVIASHSCVYAICPHDRNLTDDQIRAIAKNGGLVGINFYKGYLSPGGEYTRVSDSLWALHRAEVDSIRQLFAEDRDKRSEALRPIYRQVFAQLDSIEVDVGTVVDHIDYIVNLVGPDYVGLGSDFDGIPSLPEGLEDCSMVPNITKELVARGYSKENINKILGGNFMRVFREVCDN